MTQGPLAGMKVLDFSQMMAGPYGTQMLGDLGAEIVKVERLGSGEWERGLASMGEYFAGESPFFLAMNRNKKSLTLDLKQPEAKEIVYKLVRESDAFIENFRPGVLDKLGYGYEALSAVNPGLIYCSSTGYGSSGPYTKRPGQDLILQGISGIINSTGTKDASVPAGTSIVDASTAMMNVISILAAFAHKLKTGEGQRIEVNMLSTAISIQCQEAFAHLNMGQKWERSETGIGAPWLSAPFGVYSTKDGFMTIAMASVRLLGQIMGLPELEKYEDGPDCFTDRDAIKRIIEARTVDKTTAEWLELLWKHDVWSGPVNTFEEVFRDPQVRHNGLVQQIMHPVAGEMNVVGFPTKFSKTEPSYRLHPPTVGEHNREILNALGYSDADIARLVRSGVTDLPKGVS